MGEVFVVENIKKMRVENGETQYLIEWAGYPGQDTWERKGNIMSEELLQEFHDKLAAGTLSGSEGECVPTTRRGSISKPKADMDLQTKLLHKKIMAETNRRDFPFGFSLGWTDLRVVSLEMVGQLTFYLIKYREEEEPEWTPSHLALEYCPDALNHYYDNQLKQL